MWRRGDSRGPCRKIDIASLDAELTNPDFSGRVLTPEEIAAGEHRRYVGGVWESHGRRQLEFMISRGLRPHHRLIDIGCGAFRAGRHFVDYLEPGHYYGVDANHSVMQAGYDTELTDEQRARLPIENLRANDRFDTDFEGDVRLRDRQLGLTHVSLNHIRLCMFRLDRVMAPGGEFCHLRAQGLGPDRRHQPAKKRNRLLHEKNNTSTTAATGVGRAVGDWE